MPFHHLQPLFLLWLAARVQGRTIPVYHLNAQFDHRSVNKGYFVCWFCRCWQGVLVDWFGKNYNRDMRDYHSNKHDCLHTTQSLPFPTQVRSAGNYMADWGNCCLSAGYCLHEVPAPDLLGAWTGAQAMLHAFLNLIQQTQMFVIDIKNANYPG